MPQYSRLTREQRYTIQTLLRKGHRPAEIARTLDVSPSSISREVRRDGMNSNSYSCQRAQKHAESAIRSKAHVGIAAEVWALVHQRLVNKQWSPEQISSTLKKEKLASVSHESIYRYIYENRRGGGELYKHLRHNTKTYKKRGLGRERRGTIKNAISIEKRPKIVDTRERIGDWEMDTVIGRIGGRVLVTMVERKSRYLKVLCKEALPVASCIISALKPSIDKVHTMTFDNGKEFAHHELISELLESQSYFAHPYHSWERGLNENTNGLLRQYFPKGSSFDQVTEAELQRVEDLLNSRPRKSLDWKTPNDIFTSITQPPPVALAA